MERFRLDEAYEIYKKTHNLRPTTLRIYDYNYRKHISSYFNDSEVFEINSEMIHDFCNHLLEEKKLAPGTVTFIIVLLKSLLINLNKHDYANLIIPHIEPLRYDNQRMRILTEEEAKSLLLFLKENNPTWHDIAFISLNTGMRLAEIVGLKGENVSILGKKVTLYSTKNGKSRCIPLRDCLLPIFRERTRKRSDYLFPSPRKKNAHVTEHSNVFIAAVKKLGLNNGIYDEREKVCFHSLRHTFASWLVRAEVPLVVVSRLLGHSSIKMTERYTHIALVQETKAVDLLPDLS